MYQVQVAIMTDVTYLNVPTTHPIIFPALLTVTHTAVFTGNTGKFSQIRLCV